MGFGPTVANFLHAIIDGSSSQVLVNGIRGMTFALTKVVRQGCPLSPLIFSLLCRLSATASRTSRALVVSWVFTCLIFILNMFRLRMRMTYIWSSTWTSPIYTLPSSFFNNSVQHLVWRFSGPSQKCVGLHPTRVLLR